MVNHGAPESEELITREHFNKRLRGQFPTSGIKIYNKVTVLSIYWQADYMGCIKEARAINKLFSDEFGYEVKEFAIPSEKSYLALLKEITNLIEEHGLRGSLLIVYYGGHGDSDEKDQRYGSVWTAQQEGGSDVPWDHIQALLESKDTEADVLLILDCCYAAQAARDRATSHKFQLLAAAAKGRKTPGVGETSFTSLLINQIKLLLAAKGFVSIPQLHRQLARRDAKFTEAETPIFVDMLPDDKSTPMNLYPFRRLVTEPSPSIARRPAASLTFKFTLPRGLDLDCSLKITDWLRTTAPSIIGDVQCTEAIPSVDPPETSLTSSIAIFGETTKPAALYTPKLAETSQLKKERSPTPQSPETGYDMVPEYQTS